jgi:hypothetical protein
MQHCHQHASQYTTHLHSLSAYNKCSVTRRVKAHCHGGQRHVTKQERDIILFVHGLVCKSCLLRYKSVYCLPNVCKYNNSWNINQELLSEFILRYFYYATDWLIYINDKIMSKLNSGKACHHSFLKLSSFHDLNRNNKKKTKFHNIQKYNFISIFSRK